MLSLPCSPQWQKPGVILRVEQAGHRNYSLVPALSVPGRREDGPDVC